MNTPTLQLLSPSNWNDYELIDSGGGLKLERFGRYVLQRPEHHAIWQQALPPEEWEKADGIFVPTREESGGHWRYIRNLPGSWNLTYRELVIKVAPGNSRHLGVFPEQSVHWDWMAERIRAAGRPVNVLNLFGYTGIATLAAAQAGASVTHIDASKKAISWAKENQTLSRLNNKPVRWLVDDAVKFMRREVRRGTRYDGIILDPPKFGRGPEGQVWELFQSLPELLDYCRQVLSGDPLFVVITAYAIRASALSVNYALEDMTRGFLGSIMTGELTIKEKSAGRLLSTAIYSRWQSN